MHGERRYGQKICQEEEAPDLRGAAEFADAPAARVQSNIITLRRDDRRVHAPGAAKAVSPLTWRLAGDGSQSALLHAGGVVVVVGGRQVAVGAQRGFAGGLPGHGAVHRKALPAWREAPASRCSRCMPAAGRGFGVTEDALAGR